LIVEVALSSLASVSGFIAAAAAAAA